jgi:catechol 2,3-dioxygenase-like lactoylglutathione lyase family enzyme
VTGQLKRPAAVASTSPAEREFEGTKEEEAMLDHVAIPVGDIDTSRRFYEPLFEGLGAKVMMEWPGGVLFGTDEGMVALRQSEEVTPIHIAFRADRPGVDSFYETALSGGASDNGAPGIRADLHENYYAAFVIDPDGHNIEAVCHAPE